MFYGSVCSYAMFHYLATSRDEDEATKESFELVTNITSAGITRTNTIDIIVIGTLFTRF